MTVISCVDPDGTPVNPGACEGLAVLELGLGLFANFAFSFITSNFSRSGDNLNDLPLKALYGSELSARVPLLERDLSFTSVTSF